MARAIIEHSREVWLAADHSKFNRPAMVELARFDQIDMLFTDAPRRPTAVSRSCWPQARRRRCVNCDERTPMTTRRTCSPSTRAPPARAASSSTRDGRIVAMAQREFRQIYPQPGLGRARSRRRSGQSQLATAREALAQGRPGGRATSPPSASPTSARPRCVWNRAHRRADPQRHRLAGPPRRADLRARCASEGCEPTFRAKTGPDRRRLFLGHQARAGCSTTSPARAPRPRAASSPSAPSTPG